MTPDEIRRPRPDHPIAEPIARRWSAYAFSDRPVTHDELRSLFEAARWTASAFNEQPWSYIVAAKDDPEAHARAVSCLNETNRKWAASAPVLVFCCTSLHLKHNGARNAAAEYDLGAANAVMAVQAAELGLNVHPMIGILPDRVREVFQVPEGVEPLTALAIGHRGDSLALPEPFRGRDTTPKPRKPLSTFVFADRWGEASPITG